MPPQGAHLLPRGCIPDLDLLVIAAAGDFATIWAEAHGPDKVPVPPHGGLKLLALGVEEVDVASSVANRKDVAIWRVGQAIDRVVNLQRR